MPTHLNKPDQVLTLWSFSLTARQLLLLLVGGGIGGTLWQHLTVLGHGAVIGEIVRLLLSLAPFLLALFIARYQHGEDDPARVERASLNTRNTLEGEEVR